MTRCGVMNTLHRIIEREVNNMTTIEALKELAVALGCATAVADVTGTTVAEVIKFMADNYTA